MRSCACSIFNIVQSPVLDSKMATVTPVIRRGKRGPYRCKIRTPRQTKHNRSRRLQMIDSRQIENGVIHQDCEDNMSLEPTPTEPPPEQPTDSHEPTTTTTNYSDTNMDIQPPKLFTGSVVTSVSSQLALNSFISRHHLTKNAQEDLFKLLQLHIPKDSLIPTSVFTFRKYSLLNPLCAQHISHYMCPQCYTLLPNEVPDVCPSEICGLSLEHEPLPYFFTISISEQLEIIFKSKQMHDSCMFVQSTFFVITLAKGYMYMSNSHFATVTSTRLIIYNMYFILLPCHRTWRISIDC